MRYSLLNLDDLELENGRVVNEHPVPAYGHWSDMPLSDVRESVVDYALGMCLCEEGTTSVLVNGQGKVLSYILPIPDGA